MAPMIAIRKRNRLLPWNASRTKLSGMATSYGIRTPFPDTSNGCLMTTVEGEVLRRMSSGWVPPPREEVADRGLGGVGHDRRRGRHSAHQLASEAVLCPTCTRSLRAQPGSLASYSPDHQEIILVVIVGAVVTHVRNPDHLYTSQSVLLVVLMALAPPPPRWGVPCGAHTPCSNQMTLPREYPADRPDLTQGQFEYTRDVPLLAP